MASSEIVDSGRIPGGRSNFSHTCNLLSQYLKEKGSFGELSLGFTQNSESKGDPAGTMNLLGIFEKSDKNPSGPRNPKVPSTVFPKPAAGRDETQKKSHISAPKSQPETAPMTIFYAGQVIVFNDFPADKAKEIMMLASKSTAAPSPPAAESTTSFPTIVPTSFGMQDRALPCPQPPLDSDLPIARKNSLARFLEKRKDRVTANAPYQTIKPAAPPLKPVKTEGWLGLAPQFPQIQRH